MPPDSVGERYYSDTTEGIRRLEQYLCEQKPRPTYPDRTTLIHVGIKICQMMRVALANERESSSHSPGFDIFQLCATYNKHLADFEKQILNFIPLIDPYAQPFEIIEPIKSFIRKFEPNFVLILRSYSKNMYELNAIQNLYSSYVNIFSPYVPEEYLSFNEAPKWFVFLSFPHIHSRDVLRHIITVSHEMLHLRDYVLGITSSLLNEIYISESDIQTLVDQIGNFQIPTAISSSPPLTMETIYSRHEIERETKEICSNILENWLSEIVADLLATSVFGPAYFFSLAHLSLSLGIMDQHSASHPSSRFRLKIMWEILNNLGYIDGHGGSDREVYLELGKWQTYLDEDVNPICIPPVYEPHCKIAELKVLATKTTILTKVADVTEVESYKADIFKSKVPKLVELLDHGISPAEIKEGGRITPADLPSILNAGYIFFLTHLERIYSILGNYGDNHLHVSKLNELLLHAIQASTIFQRWLNLHSRQYIVVSKGRRNICAKGTHGAAPSEIELLSKMNTANISERLIITPYLEIDLHNGTIDLHLGTKFLLFKLTQHGAIDPSTITEEQAFELLERQQLRLGDALVLHPRQLLLASTLEYVSIPLDLGATVITRSSYGRLGLITATSIFVHPGFKGCLTLELTNVGNSPITLRPGERIAQHVFEYHIPSGKSFTSKYLLATGPEFPKMWEDKDREFPSQLGTSN